MTSGEVRAGTRRTELDALRGVAVILVVVNHTLGGVFPSERGLVPAWPQQGGLVGVQLFFVLSGYLITGILMRGQPLGAFYRRRVRRLYPTLLVVSAVAVAWTGDVVSALRGVTYTENLAAGSHGGWTMSHAWSLAVEEQFYLVWPVVMVLARRHAAKVAAVGIVVTWVLQATVDWSEHAVYVGLRWDAVLIGCLIALTGWRGNRASLLAGLGVLTVVFAGVDFGYPVVTVACAAVIGSVPEGFRAGWLVRAGLISYPLYLWHVLVLRLNTPALAALALSVVLAEATYRLVDRRAQGSLPPVLDRHRRLLMQRTLVTAGGRSPAGEPPRLDRHVPRGDVPGLHDMENMQPVVERQPS